MRRNREYERFLSLARSQVIAHPGVTVCWDIVVKGIEHRLVTPVNLPKVIDALARGGGRGCDEIDFDWSLEEDDTIELTFVRDKYTCPGKLLIAELERLLRRYRGEPDPGPSSSPGGGNGSQAGSTRGGGQAGAEAGSGPDMLDFLAGLLGTTPEALAGGDAAGLRRRFAELGSEVEELTRALLSEDPGERAEARERAEALRAHLQEESASGARRLDGLREQMKSFMAAGHELDTDALASTLHILADWLQGKRQDAGDAVDALLAGLERAVGPLVAGHAADAEATERIRNSARASIAARLREAGASPSSGEQ